MESLRVKSKLEIEVNDQGEKISMCPDDANFLDSFYALANKMKAETQDDDSINGRAEHMKGIMNSIDGVFGENTCRKVFGDIIPSPFLIADFFEQLIPIIEKYTEARKTAIEQKYSKYKKEK